MGYGGGLLVQIFVLPVHVDMAIDQFRTGIAEAVGLFVLVLLEGGLEVVGEEAIAVLGVEVPFNPDDGCPVFAAIQILL